MSHTPRKMRAAEFNNPAEQMQASFGEARRCFCVEHASGLVVARLLTWSQACLRAEELDAELTPA